MLALMLPTLKVSAQDAPVYEQYMFDNSLLNPSFIGLVDATQVRAMHRQQWTGWDNAPYTTLCLFRTRLKERDGGLGGYIYRDQNGANVRTGVQFGGSFQFLLKTKRSVRTILSFGITGSLFAHTLNEFGYNVENYDPIINGDRNTYLGYDLAAGALFSHRSFFVGASFDNLLQWSSRAYNSYREPVTCVLMNTHIGNTFHLSPKVYLAPTLIYKTNLKKEHQIDVEIRVKLMTGQKIKSMYIKRENEFFAGVVYKQTLDAAVGNYSPLALCPMLGFTYKGFSITYLYELGLTSIMHYNAGTHQISLGFRKYRDKQTVLGNHYTPASVYDF